MTPLSPLSSPARCRGEQGTGTCGHRTHTSHVYFLFTCRVPLQPLELGDVTLATVITSRLRFSSGFVVVQFTAVNLIAFCLCGCLCRKIVRCVLSVFDRRSIKKNGTLVASKSGWNDDKEFLLEDQELKFAKRVIVKKMWMMKHLAQYTILY